MRRVGQVLATVSLLVLPAYADGQWFAPTTGIPEREIIGFSENGRFFAFELYGYDEYSDWAFSRIAIIDTRTSQLEGEQISSSLPPDEFPAKRQDAIAIVRDAAADQASSILASLGFNTDGELIGRRLVSNPVTEIATSAEFIVYPRYPLATEGVTLALGEFRLPAPDHCVPWEPGYMAVEIVLEGNDGNARSVYRDERLAANRGCPEHYTISDVIIYDPAGDSVAPTVVVLLNSFNAALEGYDRRLAAVAFDLPDGPGWR